MFSLSKRRSTRCPYPLARRWCLHVDEDQLLDLKRQVHILLYKLLQCRREKTWTKPPEKEDHPVKWIVTKERVRGVYWRCWISSFGRLTTYVGLTNETLLSVLYTCKSWNVSLLFTCFFTLLANIQTSSFFEASLAPFLRMEPLSYLWMYLAREVPCTGAFLCLVTPTKAIHR